MAIALGAGAIALAADPMGDASRKTASVFALFGGVILIAGGIRFMVGPEKLNELLKPQRNRRR